MLAAGALIVVMMGAWGVSGALRVQALRQEIETARRDLETLEARRRALTETIDRLRNDPGYLEKLAREEHGLVREGETVLKFPSRR
jgi:cell division protein FtsB